MQLCGVVVKQIIDLMCEFNTVALKQRTLSKRQEGERNMAVRPNARLQSAVWKCFTRANVTLFIAKLNKQYCRCFEKERFSLPLRESISIVNAKSIYGSDELAESLV